MPTPRKHLPKKCRHLPSGIEYRDGRFRVRFVVDGHRRSETYPTLEVAKEALAARRTDAARHRLGFITTTNAVTLEELAEYYIQHYVKTNGKTNWTVWQQNDRFRLNRLLARLGHLKLAAISPQIVEEYRKQEIMGGRTPDTVRRDVKMLKSLLNHAVRWGMISSNPVASVASHAVTVTEKRPEVLTDEEIKRLFDQLTGERVKYRPLITLALTTGLRLRELLTLRWSDIDWQARTLTVRAEVAKSRRSRTLPLNHEAVEALVSIIGNQSESVFGHLPNLWGIRSATRRIFRAAGIKKKGGGQFHLFRHVYASRLIQAGVDIRTVQALLGHSDMKVTLIYLHTSDSLKRQAVEKLSTFAASM